MISSQSRNRLQLRGPSLFEVLQEAAQTSRSQTRQAALLPQSPSVRRRFSPHPVENRACIVRLLRRAGPWPKLLGVVSDANRVSAVGGSSSQHTVTHLEPLAVRGPHMVHRGRPHPPLGLNLLESSHRQQIQPALQPPPASPASQAHVGLTTQGLEERQRPLGSSFLERSAP